MVSLICNRHCWQNIKNHLSNSNAALHVCLQIVINFGRVRHKWNCCKLWQGYTHDFSTERNFVLKCLNLGVTLLTTAVVQRSVWPQSSVAVACPRPSFRFILPFNNSSGEWAFEVHWQYCSNCLKIMHIYNEKNIAVTILIILIHECKVAQIFHPQYVLQCKMVFITLIYTMNLMSVFTCVRMTLVMWQIAGSC